MSLFSWLFGDRAEDWPSVVRRAETPPAATTSVSTRRPGTAKTTAAALGLEGDGSFPLACVGESHYQAAFVAICGPRTGDGVDRRVTARLVLEDANPYDPAAVRIEVRGHLVAYLSRTDARAYRDALAAAGRTSATLECCAEIRGGWDRSTGDQGDFGIFLDLPLYGPPPA